MSQPFKSGIVRKKPGQKILSIFVCLFLTSNQVFAGIPAAGSQPVYPDRIQGAMPVEIPANLGRVIDYFPGTGDKLVIHIQDAHSSLEAQKSIQGILQYLKDKKEIQTIFLEGATRALKPELYDLHTDPEQSLKIAERLMERSELTGAEMFLLSQHVKDQCTRDCVRGEGIESIPDYVKNIESYRRLKKESGLIDEVLERIAMAARAYAKENLNPALRDFFEAMSGFETHKQDLAAYLKVLKKTAQEALEIDLENPRYQFEMPMLVRYFQVLAKEPQLDQSKVEKERKELEAFLKSSGASQELIELVAGIDKGERSIRRTLEKLYEEMSPKGFSFKQWPNWSDWAGLAGLRQELEAKPMMDEVEMLGEKVLEALAQNEKEKEFLRMHKKFVFLQKLLHLELARSEWQVVAEAKEKDYEPVTIVRYFSGRKPGRKWKEAGRLSGMAAEFYRAALAREESFVKVLETWQSRSKEKRTVVVAGGFHTQGLELAMRQRGIGYVSIQPFISAMNAKEEKQFEQSMTETSTAQHFLRMVAPAEMTPGERSLVGAPHRLKLMRQTAGADWPIIRQRGVVPELLGLIQERVHSEIRFAREWTPAEAALVEAYEARGQERFEFEALQELGPEFIELETLTLQKKRIAQWETEINRLKAVLAQQEQAAWTDEQRLEVLHLERTKLAEELEKAEAAQTQETRFVIQDAAETSVDTRILAELMDNAHGRNAIKGHFWMPLSNGNRALVTYGDWGTVGAYVFDGRNGRLMTSRNSTGDIKVSALGDLKVLQMRLIDKFSNEHIKGHVLQERPDGTRVLIFYGNGGNFGIYQFNAEAELIAHNSWRQAMDRLPEDLRQFSKYIGDKQFRDDFQGHEELIFKSGSRALLLYSAQGFQIYSFNAAGEFEPLVDTPTGKAQQLSGDTAKLNQLIQNVHAGNDGISHHLWLNRGNGQRVLITAGTKGRIGIYLFEADGRLAPAEGEGFGMKQSLPDDLVQLKQLFENGLGGFSAKHFIWVDDLPGGERALISQQSGREIGVYLFDATGKLKPVSGEGKNMKQELPEDMHHLRQLLFNSLGDGFDLITAHQWLYFESGDRVLMIDTLSKQQFIFFDSDGRLREVRDRDINMKQVWPEGLEFLKEMQKDLLGSKSKVNGFLWLESDPQTGRKELLAFGERPAVNGVYSFEGVEQTIEGQAQVESIRLQIEQLDAEIAQLFASVAAQKDAERLEELRRELAGIDAGIARVEAASQIAEEVAPAAKFVFPEGEQHRSLEKREWSSDGKDWLGYITLNNILKLWQWDGTDWRPIGTFDKVSNWQMKKAGNNMIVLVEFDYTSKQLYGFNGREWESIQVPKNFSDLWSAEGSGENSAVVIKNGSSRTLFGYNRNEWSDIKRDDVSTSSLPALLPLGRKVFSVIQFADSDSDAEVYEYDGNEWRLLKALSGVKDWSWRIVDEDRIHLEFDFMDSSKASETVILEKEDVQVLKDQREQIVEQIEQLEITLKSEMRKSPAAAFKKGLQEYYGLKLAMLEALNRDDGDGFKKTLNDFYAKTDELKTLLDAAKSREPFLQAAIEVGDELMTPGGDYPGFLFGHQQAEGVVHEIEVLGTGEGDDFYNQLKETIIKELATDLYPDSGDADVKNRQRIEEKLRERVKTAAVRHMLPLSDYEARPFTQWKEDAYNSLASIALSTSAWGSYSLVLKQINVFPYPTGFSPFEKALAASDEIRELVLRSTIKHEAVHLLADDGDLKVPVEWEQLTWAFDIMERVKHLPAGASLAEYSADFGEPAIVELYEAGREMGESGEFGFVINPLLDSKAGYFFIEPLIERAKSIYAAKGLPVLTLETNAYSRERAAAILLGGIFSTHPDTKNHPYKSLRIFFEDLYKLYAPVSEDIQRDVSKVQKNILEHYVKPLIPRGTDIVESAGVWRLETEGEEKGFYYSPADFVPRGYDIPADLRGTPEGMAKAIEAMQERNLGHATLAIDRAGISDYEADQVPADHPAFKFLWETLWTPALFAAHVKDTDGPPVSVVNAALIHENLRAGARWIQRALKDRYDPALNPMVAKAQLASLPYHLQFLDSLLYIFTNGLPDEAGASADPRVTNSEVAKALEQAYGDFADELGWGKAMTGMTESEVSRNETAKDILEKIAARIWSEYERLYELAVEKAKKDLLEKAANRKLTDAEAQQMFGQMQQAQKQQLMQLIQQIMQQAGQQQQAGSQQAGGQQAGGQTGGQAGGQQAGGLAGQLSQLQQQVAGLSQQLSQLAAQAGNVKQEVGNAQSSAQSMAQPSGQGGEGAAAQQAMADAAKKLETAASDTVNQASKALNQAKDLDNQTAGAQAGSDKLQEQMPWTPPSMDGQAKAAAEKILQEAKDLMKLANQLAQQASQIEKNAQGTGQADGQQKLQQAIEKLAQTAQAMKENAQGMIQDSRGMEKNLDEAGQKLEQAQAAVQQIQKMIGELSGEPGQPSPASPASPAETGQGKPGQAATSQGSAADSSQSGGDSAATGGVPNAGALQNLARPPVEFNLNTLGPATETEKKGKQRPAAAGKFDEDDFDELEAVFGTAKELTTAERNELQGWLDEPMRGINGEEMTVQDIIDLVRKALDALLERVLELQKVSQDGGPLLVNAVKAATGQAGGWGAVVRAGIPNLLISILVDSSGSMGGQATGAWSKTKIAQLTMLILFKSFFAHNQKRKLEGQQFKPLLAEVSDFTTNAQILIPHQKFAETTEPELDYFIYHALKDLERSGGTNYSEAVGRLLSTIAGYPLPLDSDVMRMIFVLTDEQVDPGQMETIRGAEDYADSNQMDYMVAPLGTPEEIAEALSLHDARHAIDPAIVEGRLELLPLAIIAAVLKRCEEQVSGFHMPSFLQTYAPRAELRMSNQQRIPIEESRLETIYDNDGNAYETFFYYDYEGRNFLVHKAAEGYTTWERGPGGANVPLAAIPMNRTNEDYLYEMISWLFVDNFIYTSVSPDKKWFVREAEDGQVELFFRNESDQPWQSVTKWGWNAQAEEVDGEPGRYRNLNGLQWTTGETETQMKLFSETEETVEFREAENPEDIYFERSPDGEKLFGVEIASKRVLIFEREGDVWKQKQDLSMEKFDDATEAPKKFLNVEGYPGTGKGVLMREMARLMNVEIYKIPAHEKIYSTQLQTETSLKNGLSADAPSDWTYARHFGAIFMIDEAHKLDPATANSTKSDIASGMHHWIYQDAQGAVHSKSVRNHPFARTVWVTNPLEIGIQGAAVAKLDSAMRSREKRMRINWQDPAQERELLLKHLEKVAKDTGKTLPDDLEATAEKMITQFATVRLQYAGFSADEIKEALATDRAKSTYPNWLRVLRKGPAGQTSLTRILRTPSHRVLKNIFEHFVQNPKDYEYRKWSTIRSYFNFDAEYDPKDTYNQFEMLVKSKFEDKPEAAGKIPHFDLEKSFKRVKVGQQYYLEVTAVDITGAEDSLWDSFRVPLHPDSVIVQGGRKWELPEMLQRILIRPANHKAVYDILQTLSLNPDLIIVGPPSSGKTTIGMSIQETVSGPGLELIAMFRGKAVEDLLFKQGLGTEGVAFESGYTEGPVIGAMRAGKIAGFDETTQAESNTVTAMNEVAEKREIPHPGTKRVLHATPGFKMFHYINPADGDSNLQVSAEWYERHRILLLPPLPLEEAMALSSGFGDRLGQQVNPKLIGAEPERDTAGNVIQQVGLTGLMDWSIREHNSDPKKFKEAIDIRRMGGIIREVYAKFDQNKALWMENQTVVNRLRELGVADIQTTQQLVQLMQRWMKGELDSEWEKIDSGLKVGSRKVSLKDFALSSFRRPQQILFEIVKSNYRGFLGDELDVKPAVVEAKLKEGLIQAKLWIEDPKRDGVLELLNSEDIVVSLLDLLEQGEPALSQAPMEMPELKALLISLQRNVSGTSVPFMLERVQFLMNDLLIHSDDPQAAVEVWSKLPFDNKLNRFAVLAETHRVLNLIIEKRGYGQEGRVHTEAATKTMRQMLEGMEQAIEMRDWPVYILEQAKHPSYDVSAALQGWINAYSAKKVTIENFKKQETQDVLARLIIFGPGDKAYLAAMNQLYKNLQNERPELRIVADRAALEEQLVRLTAERDQEQKELESLEQLAAELPGTIDELSIQTQRDNVKRLDADIAVLEEQFDELRLAVNTTAVAVALEVMQGIAPVGVNSAMYLPVLRTAHPELFVGKRAVVPFVSLLQNLPRSSQDPVTIARQFSQKVSEEELDLLAGLVARNSNAQLVVLQAGATQIQLSELSKKLRTKIEKQRKEQGRFNLIVTADSIKFNQQVNAHKTHLFMAADDEDLLQSASDSLKTAPGRRYFLKDDIAVDADPLEHVTALLAALDDFFSDAPITSGVQSAADLFARSLDILKAARELVTASA